MPGISRYWFCDSSYQIKALVIISLEVEIALCYYTIRYQYREYLVSRYIVISSVSPIPSLPSSNFIELTAFSHKIFKYKTIVT